jgi:phosphate transport system substrate-binding protein
LACKIASNNDPPPASGASQWTNLQFAFSEAPPSPSDITAYNAAANSVANGAGPAIVVPFIVVPIAFAYNAQYGTNGGLPMTFNVKFPQKINNVTSGGLRLNRSAYCKIFNGEITNWNDAALQTLNGGVSLHNVANDDATRWGTEGVPIRLVGRADSSGGTDVFTRAMAAQCDTFVTLNKFDKASERLPYDNTSAIDISRLQSSSLYKPSSPSSSFSGTTQSLNGLVFDRTGDNICLYSEVSTVTRLCDTTLAPGGIFTNTPTTPGLFMLADGSSGVEEAIRTTVNNALIASTTPGVLLNGKFGYIGADFVAPSSGSTLFAAALQKGTSTTSYVMPSALNAAAAFGAVLPPQSTTSSGAFNPLDKRTLGSVDPFLPINASTNPATPINRSNPLHWAATLYNPQAVITKTLAAPLVGYPVTGTAFLLTYTCFKAADPLVPGNNPKRFGIANYVGLMLGQVTKNSIGGEVAPTTFQGTGKTSIGILAQSNTTLPSTAWKNAIYNTFFVQSADAALAAKNLWIQDAQPTLASDVDAVVDASDKLSNPACDPAKGA